MEMQDYKQGLLTLQQAGFTTQQINRLTLFKRDYLKNEMDQAALELSRLQFARWLVMHGKLSDQLSPNNSSLDDK